MSFVETGTWDGLDLMVSKPVKKDPHISPYESYPSFNGIRMTQVGPRHLFFKSPLVILFIREVWEAPSRWRE